jgi:hypothetical protein
MLGFNSSRLPGSVLISEAFATIGFSGAGHLASSWGRLDERSRNVQLNFTLIPDSMNGAECELRHEPTFTAEGPLVLDIGGEGRHSEAWNLNPRSRKTLGQQCGQLIPRLIQGRGECIPLPDRIVDVLIVERTPLRSATLSEMLRVASPSARIILRHASAHRRDPHRLAVQVLRGAVEQRKVMIGRQTVQETVIRLSPCRSSISESGLCGQRLPSLP